MNTPQTQAKAIVAGILAVLFAGISALGTVVTGTQTLADVTTAQWLYVIGAMVTAGGSVYGITWSVTNAPPKTAAQNSLGVYNMTSLPAAAPVTVPGPTAPAVTAPSFDQVAYGADGAPAKPEPTQEPNAPATPAPTA